MRQLRAQQAQLVGLDQVFITNAAPTCRQLAEQVNSPAARAYFARLAGRYEHQAQAGLHAAKPSFVMTRQSPAAIDSLLLLTKAERPAVRQLAQDYAASYRIYVTGRHQARVNLLKHKLLQQVRPYQTATGLATPKMLFKFGALHLARGASPIKDGEFYGVGNLVQNLADVQTTQSLHLLVLGKQGAKVSGLGLLLANQPAETYTPALYGPQSALPVSPFMEQATGPA